MKSWRDGPALSWSRKVVGKRRVVDVGGDVGSVGSVTAVAKVRVVWWEGRTVGRGGANRQRNLVALEAIVRGNKWKMEQRCKVVSCKISERRLDIDFSR